MNDYLRCGIIHPRVSSQEKRILHRFEHRGKGHPPKPSGQVPMDTHPLRRPHAALTFSCRVRPARPSVWGLSSLEISCSCQVYRNQHGSHGRFPRLPRSCVCQLTPGGASTGEHGGSPPVYWGQWQGPSPTLSRTASAEQWLLPSSSWWRRAGPVWRSGSRAILSTSGCPSAP